jgi:hypothetical protein
MAERIHVAIAVSDIDLSIQEYTQLTGTEPELVVPGEYALFRTESMNLSLRRTGDAPGTVRHLGFERDDASHFSVYRDRHGLVWENFNREHQRDEIAAAWPDHPRGG